ncbi:MAG: hypothetical protein ACP5PW_09335, partial [Candidatus Dormibacteria bacterium]
RGTPTGAQFAAKTSPESGIELAPTWPGLMYSSEPNGDGLYIEEWMDHSGRLQDPPDGSRARRWFRPDGSILREEHYQAGYRQDRVNRER